MGNPFVHCELLSADVDKAKSFYGTLFDWTLEDISGVGGAAYTLIKIDERTGGGMMQNPMPGKPSGWIPYVLVENLEEAAAKAKALGATIIKGRMEVPDRGSFYLIADPNGAMMGLWECKKA